MKTDGVLYQRIYRLLRNQIECGLLPCGSRLPSRMALCEDFQVSEKTVRRVLELLAKDGLIETTQRKRPVVAQVNPTNEEKKSLYVLVDGKVANDLFQTGRLICCPLVERGLSLCTEADWRIPLTVIEAMDPSNSIEFWRLSNLLWRFFITRNGNDLVIRVVDSLGFSKIDPLPGSLRVREAYLENIHRFVQIASSGGDIRSACFEDLSYLYGLSGDKTLEGNLYRVAPDSPLRTGLNGLERRIRSTEERYSHVYMDVLGLISIGRYQPGDRLPSHLELQKQYGVSADTTNKAIRILQDWGVVTAKRGSGIYVAMDLSALKRAHIPEEMIACHLRRFLDNMELLCFTIDGVAAHAAGFVTAEEAEALKTAIQRHWDEEYIYQTTPATLLEFITEHIHYAALKEIYKVVLENYHIGRSIPRLVKKGKFAENIEIHQHVEEAVDCLARGDCEGFSARAAELFWRIQQMIIAECKKLGYWEIAEQVYDGSALWQERNFSE
ncbi:GntR family transcriptional regulator [Enterocloster aldenensis]|uniref:GntR family transcriptional regulator n=1 Tax=Enterocloster aldenensis TaxID=358742 RepID=UPI000E47567A|nr:GntR family transcriptional regulator [Enterocloster aldenensis]